MKELVLIGLTRSRHCTIIQSVAIVPRICWTWIFPLPTMISGAWRIYGHPWIAQPWDFNSKRLVEIKPSSNIVTVLSPHIKRVSSQSIRGKDISFSLTHPFFYFNIMSELYQRIIFSLGLSSYQPIPSQSADAEPTPASRPPNPKGFFANERTLLSWLHFSVVLGGLAVFLLNHTDSDIGFFSASLFGIISALIMVQSYYNFRWRAAKLKNKEHGYYGKILSFCLFFRLNLIAPRNYC